MHSPDDHYPLNRHLNRHFSHLLQAFAITMILWFGSFLFISSLRKSKSAIDRIPVDLVLGEYYFDNKPSARRRVDYLSRLYFSCSLHGLSLQ